MIRYSWFFQFSSTNRDVSPREFMSPNGDPIQWLLIAQYTQETRKTADFSLFSLTYDMYDDGLVAPVDMGKTYFDNVGSYTEVYDDWVPLVGKCVPLYGTKIKINCNRLDDADFGTLNIMLIPFGQVQQGHTQVWVQANDRRPIPSFATVFTALPGTYEILDVALAVVQTVTIVNTGEWSPIDPLGMHIRNSVAATAMFYFKIWR